jgi:hypothetical protein
MKKKFLLFILLFCCLFFGCSSKTLNQEPDKPKNISNFEINISSDKNEYSQLEPVWITIKVKNISLRADSLYNFDYVEDLLQRLTVSDSNGNKLKYHYYFIDKLQTFLKFDVNEEKSFDVELSLGYSENRLGEKFSPIYIPPAYFSEGKFSVKQPQGNDLILFNRLKDISKTYDVKFRDWESYIYDLKKLYSDNPDNIYSEEIFYNCLFIINMLQVHSKPEYRKYINEEFLDEIKTFIGKNPNTLYNERIIQMIPFYVRNLNISKQYITEFLNSLIEKYPNTKAQFIALKYLKDEKYIDRFFQNRRKGSKDSTIQN